MKPTDDLPLTARGKKKKTLPDFSSWVRGFFKANEEDAASKPLKPEPGLYIVATPIGNLGDITLRALWTLQQADLILCEDTRVSGSMLHQFGISKPLLPCHDHNETTRIHEICGRISQGEVIALISDAGTPMISDPGYKLAQACRAQGHAVISVPGASALLTALACAGLPTDRFLFVGFLPAKQVARQKEIAALAALRATLVFYESPQRVTDTLADLATHLSGTRHAAVGRELTKLYEEMRTGTLADLAAQFQAEEASPRGEFVILVAPDEAEEQSFAAEELDGFLQKALETMSLRDAVAAVTEATGLKKSDIYQRALTMKT